MIQSAVDGVIDFTQARFYDSKWSTYLTFMLAGIQRKNNRDLRRDRYHQQVSWLASPKLAAERFDDVAQLVSDLYFDIRATYYPDDKNVRVQHEKEMARQDIESWQGQFGALEDPDTQRKLDEFVRGMRELHKKTAEEQRKSVQGSMGYLARELGFDPSDRSRRP